MPSKRWVEKGMRGKTVLELADEAERMIKKIEASMIVLCLWRSLDYRGEPVCERNEGRPCTKELCTLLARAREVEGGHRTRGSES